MLSAVRSCMTTAAVAPEPVFVPRKGVRNLLCKAPVGPYRQKVPDTFSGNCCAVLGNVKTVRALASRDARARVVRPLLPGASAPG